MFSYKSLYNTYNYISLHNHIPYKSIKR